MNFIYFKDKEGRTRNMGIFFPEEPSSLFEKQLQEDIYVQCRDILLKYLPENRPQKLRSPYVFGDVHNPNIVFLDDGDTLTADKLPDTAI